MSTSSYAIRDSATMLRRQLLHIVRYPGMTFGVLLIPVFMLLIFRYVFGATLGTGLGAGAGGYINYLTPGIIVLAVTSASVATAVSVNTDMTEGIINRFRTMPIARVSVLTGHVLGSVIQTVAAAALITARAVAVGFRPSASVAGWLGAIGPAPHQHFATACRLASWATLCPYNYMSARKSKGGRTGDGGAYIKPLLIQAAWAAVRVPGRLQARFGRLVRKFGGPRNKGAQKRAITAIAHTLLKIAYTVLKTGQPYQDLGADFYTRRNSPEEQQKYLERQLQKLHPGCTITITISPPEAALTPGA